jgi:DNA-binding transcriptional MerR regulator
MLDIGQVVKETGVPPSTLHVWEDKGLLTPIGRSGLRRQYSASTIQRIAFIVICQRSGFSLAEIADLLEPDAFAEGKHRLVSKVAELRQRRDNLSKAIDGIEHALTCSHESPLECPEFLAELPSVLPVPRDDRSRPDPLTQ